MKVFLNLFDIWFLKAVFVPLCFWLFSWLKLIQTLQFGGVSESSRSPLHDGHRVFENQCRNAWENWSWCCQPSLGNWKNGKKMMSVFLVPTSTSIFSGISASIFKISVPIMKRRSWGFRNTPNLQSLDNFEPSYGTSKKAMFWDNWRFTCILNKLEYHQDFCNL